MSENTTPQDSIGTWDHGSGSIIDDLRAIESLARKSVGMPPVPNQAAFVSLKRLSWLKEQGMVDEHGNTTGKFWEACERCFDRIVAADETGIN